MMSKRKRKGKPVQRKQIVALAAIIFVLALSLFIFLNPNDVVVGDIPPYIDAESVYDGDSCITIIQEPVWERGNDAEALSEHISASITVSMESKQNPPGFWLSMGRGNDVIPVVDSNGNTIGTAGSPIQVCANHTGLKTGKQLLTLEFETLSGELHRFSWYTHTFRSCCD